MQILLLALCLSLAGGVGAFATQSSTPQQNPETAGEQTPLPGDWGPELLYGILSSPNPEAPDALYRAAFAAGPAIIPQLQAALKDDRTAEFAAQSLAYIGGKESFTILRKLVADPRDLDLRRFYYGALGEMDSTEATQTLLDVVNRSDQESDRTVTEAAILALTVHSSPAIVSSLKRARAKIKDPVISDDLDDSIAIIQARINYLSSVSKNRQGGSIQDAIHTYFIAALEPPPAAASTGAPAHPSVPPPKVHIDIKNLTFSPDKGRVLARVIFEDPSATANYDLVLQKSAGEWKVVSAWLGEEREQPSAEAGKQSGTNRKQKR